MNKVQVATNQSSGTNAVTLIFASPTVSGHAIVIQIASSISVTGIVDDGSNTYLMDVSNTDGAGGFAYIYSCGNASAAQNITISLSGLATITCSAVEVDTSLTLDQTSNAGGVSGASSPGSITTTKAVEYATAVTSTASGSQSWSTPTGYTSLVNDTSGGQVGQCIDRILSSTQALNPNWNPYPLAAGGCAQSTYYMTPAPSPIPKVQVIQQPVPFIETPLPVVSRGVKSFSTVVVPPRQPIIVAQEPIVDDAKVIRLRTVTSYPYSHIGSQLGGYCQVRNNTTSQLGGYCSGESLHSRMGGACGYYVHTTSQLGGGSKVANASVAGYVVYVGVNVPPDINQPPTAYSASLPITIGSPPPISGTNTLYVLVRSRNQYGLESTKTGLCNVLQTGL